MFSSHALRALLLAAALAAIAGCGDDDPAVTPPDASGQVPPDASNIVFPGLDASAPQPGPDAGTLPGADASTPQADASTPASDASTPAPFVVDLRADVNRNGTVDLADPTEDQAEETWDGTHGAVFLANLDDDPDTCPFTSVDDVDLPKCNDADDTTTNGADDLLDLARLKVAPIPQAPADAVGRIALSTPGKTYVRLFKGSGTSFTYFNVDTATLTSAELQAGVELAIEGTDIVRDRAVWDGFVDVTLTVTAAGAPTQTDTVRMRVSPLILSHHLSPPDQIYATALTDTVPNFSFSIRGNVDPDSQAFLDDLRAAIAGASVGKSLLNMDAGDSYYGQDPWTQDYFETGWMAMPKAGGQQVMRVFIRSANVFNYDRWGNPDARNPLRDAGKIVFAARGKDVAAIQAYDPNHDGNMDSLNSFGNTETIPPYTLGANSYPLGRLYRGSVQDFYPDPKMSKLLEAQAVQPPVYVDTSWLLVGHVDETVTFVRANNARGWTLAVNDPAMARTMLQQQQAAGNGAVKMFVGMKWLDYDTYREFAAEATIDQVLANTNVMNESAKAVIEVDNQLAILKAETGLTDAEILHVPFLHWTVDGYSVAYNVGTVNGISLGLNDYAAPEPHGPIINGQDIFKVQLEQEFAKVGVTVHWVEDWNVYHRGSGEIHCASNMTRQIPTNTFWWETGR